MAWGQAHLQLLDRHLGKNAAGGLPVSLKEVLLGAPGRQGRPPPAELLLPVSHSWWVRRAKYTNGQADQSVTNLFLLNKSTEPLNTKQKQCVISPTANTT